jgi:GDP-L-fucose synthase
MPARCAARRKAEGKVSYTEDFPLAGRRIFVAGDQGMVGRAVVHRLARESCEVLVAVRSEVDLKDQARTFAWLERERPDGIIIAAARVGGILANDTRPAEFLYDNLSIEANLIEGARRAGVTKLLFLGSSCIYPKMAAQPMKEDALLTGPLEVTNEWYAIAKIAGIKLCQAYRRQYGCNFISAMPTNLYGPYDNFDPVSSHVMPALMHRMHLAKEQNSPTFEIWGTGTPRREFLHVSDLADACVFLLKTYNGDSHINVGSGQEITIADLARQIADVVGWQGRFVYLTEKPDGSPRKLLDTGKLRTSGWKANTGLEEGIRSVYAWYLKNQPICFPL